MPPRTHTHGCPTCSETLHGLGNRAFWCPRCGTLVTQGLASPPALVERCRRYRDHPDAARGGAAAGARWEALGLEEAIARPEARKALAPEGEPCCD
jgi:hypothetical protein